MAKNTEIVVKKQFDLASPTQMTALAKVLKSHVVAHKLFTNIRGKNYAHVEGWQFAGGMLGLIPLITQTNRIEGSEIKWTAACDIINMKTGAVMGRGFALCSNKESTKKSFDEYAVLSMAQTRAIGKAYRNLLGWVMKLAQFEATPSEEMTRFGDTPREEAPARPSEKSSDEPLYCHGASKRGCPEGNEIDRSTSEYSKKMYGKPLCRTCQKEAKPLPRK
jgi:hypothetical protein